MAMVEERQSLNDLSAKQLRAVANRLYTELRHSKTLNDKQRNLLEDAIDADLAAVAIEIEQLGTPTNPPQDRTQAKRQSLTLVDDATHEAVAIVPERALGGNQLVRTLEQLASTRGLPKAIKTDNGKEFCSRAMLNWAHARRVQLFLIEPGKANQNAYIESFNGRVWGRMPSRALVH